MNGTDEITELLQRYGNELEDVKKLLPQLVGAIKRKTTLPQVPQFLTPQNVESMGFTTETGEPFKLEEGWLMKLTPGANGAEPAVSFITPEDYLAPIEPGKWEVLDGQTWLSPKGQKFTAEEITAQLAGIPSGIEDVLGALKRVFPKQDIAQLLEYAQRQPQNFLLDIQALGKTEETEGLLKTLFPTIEQADIDELFAVPPVLINDAEIIATTPGGRALYTQAEYNAYMDEYYVKVGREVVGGDVPDWAKVFVAGVGDLAEILSGTFHWMGQDGFAQKLKEFSWKLQPLTYDIPTAANWDVLFSPRFWEFRPGAEHGYQILRSLPFSIALLPAALLGAYAGAAGGAAVGLGTLGRTILGSLGASILASPMEAAMEAGGEFDDAMRKGLSADEAKEAADKVFVHNCGMLMGSNWAEFLAAFAPIKIGKINNLIARGLVTTARVGGRLTITGLTEAGEEAVQEIFQRQALGEEIEFDDEMKASIAIGGAMGVGLGVAGDIFTTIQNRVQQNLSPEMGETLLRRIAELKETGLTEEQAKLKALDEIAETPRGKKIVEQVVETIKEQETWSQVKIDEAFWDKMSLDERIAALKARDIEESIASKAWTELSNTQREVLATPTPPSVSEGYTREQIYNMQAEVAGLNEWLATEPAAKLTSLIKKTGWYKGEVSNLTLKQYKDLTGKDPSPNILTKDKRHVRWEYALDDVATEMGYKSGEELKEAIEGAAKGINRLDALNEELRTAQEVSPVPEQVKHRILSLEERMALIQETIAKLTALIKQAKPARAETEKLKHEELVKRVGRGAAVLEKGEGREAFWAAKARLRGELPTAEFTPPELGLMPQEVAGLFDYINVSDIDFFHKVNTADALETLLSGNIPTEGQLELLEEMFGSELVKAVLAKRSLGAKAWENFLNLINLPKAMLASWDLSAPLRQGAILSYAFPGKGISAFWAQLKALVSEKNAAAILESIKRSKYASLREQAGLYIAPIHGAAAKLSRLEESFMTKFAQYIPGITHSERAYITYLNKLRADVFDKYAALWEGEGKTLKDYKQLATFINDATGRGDVGRLNNAVPLLNALLFSPRLQMSRIMLPLRIFTLGKATRGVAIRSMATFIGANLAILMLLKLSGVADIEDDPQSPDFLKIRIGNTRLDPWAGFQQYVRFMTQLITGYRKTSVGAKVKANRWDILMNLVRSKEAPVMGLVHDILAGETFIGEEISLEPENVRKQIYNRLTPLFVQDIVDAFNTDGLFGAYTAIPGLLGWGVVSYPNPLDVIETQLGQIIDEGIIELDVSLDRAIEIIEDAKKTHKTENEWDVKWRGNYDYIRQVLNNLKAATATPDELSKAIDILEEDIALDTKARDYFKSMGDEKKATIYEKAIGQYGSIIEILDSQIYDMAKFGRDINLLTRDMTPEEVTLEKGYSSLVVAYIQMREWRKGYDAFGDKESPSYILEDDKRREARVEFLRNNPEANAMMAVWAISGIDFETREAWDIAQKMLKDLNVPQVAIPHSNVPENAIDAYFDYQEAIEKYGANSAEVKLIRLLNPEFEMWGEQTQGWGSMMGFKGIEYYRLQIKWRDIEVEYDTLETTEARDAFLVSHPDFRDDRRRLQAMDIEFPEDLIPDYVAYYQKPLKDYEDDWFLMEHKEFHEEMVNLGLWEPRDFSKVPTRAVYDLFKSYQGLPIGKDRLDFRAKHPDLDAWLLLTGKVSRLAGDRGNKGGEETADDQDQRAKRELERIQREMDERLKKMRLK